MDTAIGLVLSITSRRGFVYEGRLKEINCNEGEEAMTLNEVVMVRKEGSRAVRKALDQDREVIVQRNELTDLRILPVAREDDESDDEGEDEDDLVSEATDDLAYDDDSVTDTEDDLSSSVEPDSDLDYARYFSAEEDLDSTSGISTGHPSPTSVENTKDLFGESESQTEEQHGTAFENFLELFESASVQDGGCDDPQWNVEREYQANLELDFPTLGEVRPVFQEDKRTTKPKKKAGKNKKKLTYSQVVSVPKPHTFLEDGERRSAAQENIVNGEWVLPLPEKRSRKKKPDIMIPLEMNDVVKHKLDEFQTMTPVQGKVRQTLTKMVEEGLNKNNYQRYWAFLLYVEELELEWEMERYDIYNAKLYKDSAKHPVMLKVPGIMDKNPNVMKFDTVIVYVHREPFELTVKDIFLNTVSFVNDPNLLKEHFDTQCFGKTAEGRIEVYADVQFTVNESCLKSMHRGILLSDTWQIARLFPTVGKNSDAQRKSNEDKMLDESEIDLFNPDIEDNEEQLEFVMGVVNGTSNPYPHILFGPPGTGKTVTVVEAIKQVWLMRDDSRILVTAPSNTAADLLAERLNEDIPNSDIVRWIAPSREEFLVNPAIEDIVRSGEMTKRLLQDHRIVVVTLASAARVLNCGFPCGGITHVFVDEAGQATEPETLIPVAGILEKRGRLILSGDPNQLGPVVKSRLAEKHGLGKSLLERLMTTSPLYQKDPMTGLRDARYITKLKKNFRSHPDLLNLPSRLFYDNELEPQKERSEVSMLSKLEWVQRKGFPLIFHGTKAVHGKSDNGPSLFNVLEVEKVMTYVERLSRVLEESEIGIVSPYKRQVRMIKEELKKRFGFEDVLVGSTEEFQGQEREAMIISTVRSSFGTNVFHNLEEGDNYEVDEVTGEILFHEPGVSLVENRARMRTNPTGLGFLVNRKRFNVAITRAKSLLVVIGDPFLLQKNYNWRELIKYAYINGGYVGTELSESIKTRWNKLKEY